MPHIKTLTCPHCQLRPKRYPIGQKKVGKFYSWCVECFREYKRDKYLLDKERILNNNKKSYLKNREKKLLKQKEYYWKNKKKINVYNQTYGKENREKLRLYEIDYRNKNREHYRLKQRVARQRRRALEKSAIGSFTKEEWQLKKKKYNMKCAICGEKKELTIDHIIPLFRGGSNNIENIQPLCKICNCKKGVKL